MKSKLKSKIILLLTLGILFALLPIAITTFSFIAGNSSRSSEFSDDNNLDKKNLKIAAVSRKIHIINNSGWIDFRNDGNCTGSGSYSDPYLIEDLVIDGGGSESCIWIENTNVYFKIENCTLYNSSNAGIRFSNVNRSQLIINNCSSNECGISLENCYNNTVSGNTANYNNDDGILLWYSDNNTISGNSLYNNYETGISLRCSNNNTISGNAANNNVDGINLIYCFNNIISGNTIKINSKGIYLSSSDYNTISENTANNNFFGIYIKTSNNNIISGNSPNDNCYGIYLYVSDNSTIVGNTANNNIDIGIYLRYCNTNTIVGNTANSNSVIGIYLYGENNIASGNTVNYNREGISICGEDNIASGNIMNNCGLRIYGSLEKLSSHDIDITNLVNGKPLYYYVNEVNLGPDDFSGAGQVILVNCNNSLISNLNISYSTIAISLHYCNNNNISGNTANYNLVGIYLTYSNENTISGNYLSGNDECIVEINCQENKFSDNGDCTYGQGNDGIPIDLIFLISVISGGAVIGVASILLIRRKRKRIQLANR